MTFFREDDYFTGPPVSRELVARAEATLGVTLPDGYVRVLHERNGGVPDRTRFMTDFATSWADDHFEIRAILGVGGTRGIDSSGGFGSAYQVAEWGYPEVGVVICDMPSGGHDAVMLDYSASGPSGAPAVVYVDEDRVPRRVAESFDEFLDRLVEETG